MSQFDVLGIKALEQAWKWRESRGFFKGTQAIRVFHGPGEGQIEKGLIEGRSKGAAQGKAPWASVAIDRFGDHYWVTEWEKSSDASDHSDQIRKVLIQFLKSRGALSIVGLTRPERGLAPESETWFGDPPPGRFEVREQDRRFWIQFRKTRHPGLFLDHEPLRDWLQRHVRGLNFLNTFAYTGSLSVAAGLGGAAQVTTLDLSSSSIQWAKENMALNGLTQSCYEYIAGDVFEWLPRLRREKKFYDCVLLDPPSFSHGKKGKFSTAQDLERLHSLALEVLTDQGTLITSINSAQISWKKYESDILSACRKKKIQLVILKQMDLPETFPTPMGSERDRYLKGWIFKSCLRSGGSGSSNCSHSPVMG